MTDTDARSKIVESETRFREAFDAFYLAGMRLCDAWDADGFNADERFPLPEALRPPMSLDEWLTELAGHYGSPYGINGDTFTEGN